MAPENSSAAMHPLLHHSRRDGTPYPRRSVHLRRISRGRCSGGARSLWRRDARAFRSSTPAPRSVQRRELIGSVVTFESQRAGAAEAQIRQAQRWRRSGSSRRHRPRLQQLLTVIRAAASSSGAASGRTHSLARFRPHQADGRPRRGAGPAAPGLQPHAAARAENARPQRRRRRDVDDASPDDRRADRATDSDRSRARTVKAIWPDRAGAREPRGERPRRDARARLTLRTTSVELDDAFTSSTRACDPALREADGERYRHRMDRTRRDEFRAVLHDEGPWQGSGGLSRCRDRQAERRVHCSRERPGVEHVHDLSARVEEAVDSRPAPDPRARRRTGQRPSSS